MLSNSSVAVERENHKQTAKSWKNTVKRTLQQEWIRICDLFIFYSSYYQTIFCFVWFVIYVISPIGQNTDFIIGSSSTALAFANDVKYHCPDMVILPLFTNRCIYGQDARRMAGTTSNRLIDWANIIISYMQFWDQRSMAPYRSGISSFWDNRCQQTRETSNMRLMNNPKFGSQYITDFRLKSLLFSLLLFSEGQIFRFWNGKPTCWYSDCL